jgi:hypothetical protein
MAIYGRGQMLGSGINPESFKRDYSGFANAAAMQAQGIAGLGQSVGGIIKDFDAVKKEQKKVDAQNKASAKSIEAAITLGKSYGVGGVEETLRPFLESYNDPSLSPIEKAALLDEGKAIIPNVFGRFDASRADAIQMARLNAGNDPSARSVNLRQGKITETINGRLYEVPTIFDPSTGETRRLDGSLVGSAFRSPDVIDAGLNLPMPNAEDTGMPGDGTFPDYGGISEAMVLPPIIDPDAISAAAEPTNGQSDVSNVSPIPIETSTTTQVPAVNEAPIGQADAGMIPPGATPIEVRGTKSFRRATPEEAAGYGAAAGQIDEQTNRFYPINLPSGMTVESDGQGGIKVVQGSGVGASKDKSEKAEIERRKQQELFVDEFTNTAAEALELLPSFPSGAIGAKYGSIIGKLLPASPEGRVVSRLETLKANLSLNTINELRAASPTGGAVGNMTEKEWPLLQQKFGSLEAAEDKKDLEARLKNASITFFNTVNGTPEERAEALKKGIITSEQNETVERKYSEMLSKLGVAAPKPPANLLKSESQSIYDEFLRNE